MILPGGARYSGDLKQGLIHGKGLLEWPDGRRYEGEFAAGLMSGMGLFIEPNGDQYSGTFVDGELTGEGEYHGHEGNIYRGEFLRDLYHGPGEYQDQQGNRYQGVFAEGDLSGEGVFIGIEGERYEGEFENWRFHGSGVFSESKGTYIGEFKRGYYDGRGEFRYSEDDRVVSGYWRWGKYEGSEPVDKKSQARAIEMAIYHQNTLLQQAEKQLVQGNPEAIDLYFVAVGGYSRQDVFRKEVTFIRTRMDEQFTTAGRSLVLMNHFNSLTEFPLATTHSIEQSLQAVARKMDPEQDILMLYLTSHGSEQHEFSLVQQGLILPDLSAKRLGEIIHALPVKWKIVIVSACYSGGFIPALESPTTLVMSAAREDRKSFGCSDDSEMTYFGRAFFEHALPQANSFEEAFALSDTLITQWEKDLSEDVEHSYPQMVMGEEIKNWLPRWWQRLPPRASVIEQSEPQSVK